MKFFLFLISGLIFFNGQTYGKNQKNQQIEELQTKMKSRKYTKLNFEQTRYKALRNKKEKSTGSAYFKLPDRFLWKLDNSSQQWIFDGVRLIHWNKANAFAVMYGNSAQKGRELRNIISLVTRFDTLKKNYEVKSSQLENKKLNLQLVPRKRTGDLDRVSVEFDVENLHISRLRLNFGGGNYSEFRFFNLDTKSFSDSKFRLPKGTKIETVN